MLVRDYYKSIGVQVKNLIYYPSLEPPDKEWLKFALLYFEDFQPIIPYNRRSELSSDFQRILNETDLIHPFSPEYEQGQRASLLTIEEAERILDRPTQRRMLFGNANLQKSWKDKSNWTTILYEEKFAYEFLLFCEKNKIGKRLTVA
jgi:hypothetical protein